MAELTANTELGSPTGAKPGGGNGISGKLRAGDLPGAITFATERVRSAPADADARWNLAELLSLSGDLVRADQQLDTLMTLKPSDTGTAAQFRQLVRAEMRRREFYFEGKGLPELVMEEGSDQLRLRMELCIAIREKKTEAAASVLARARATRVPVPMVVDGSPASDVRDLDDVACSALEVLAPTGRFFWVPWSGILSAQFTPPRTARDLAFREVRLVLTNGPEATVFVPSVYPVPSGAKVDPKFALGHMTDYQTPFPGGPNTGLGQRILLAGEDREVPVLAIRSLAAAR